MATKKATSAAGKAPAKKKPTTTKKVVAKKTSNKAVSAKKVEKKTLIDQMPAPSALIGEFLGTFALAGAFIALFSGGTEGRIGIAIALIVITVVFGVISRSHFNPAVTIALWANRKFGGLKTILYVVAQVLGAVLAWFVLKALFDATFETSLIASLMSQGVDQAMIDEAGGLLEFAKANGFDTLNALAQRIGVAGFIDIQTPIIDKEALLVFFSELIGAIVFGLSAGYAFLKKNKALVKALVLGFGLFAGLIVGGGATVLNPAVAASLGAFAWGDVNAILWPIVIYVIAPVGGVVIGVTAYRFLLKDSGNCGCGDEECECKA